MVHLSGNVIHLSIGLHCLSVVGEAGHDEGVVVVRSGWNFNGELRVGADGEGMGLCGSQVVKEMGG